jgi:hypothetical protein
LKANDSNLLRNGKIERKRIGMKKTKKIGVRFVIGSKYSLKSSYFSNLNL